MDRMGRQPAVSKRILFLGVLSAGVILAGALIVGVATLPVLAQGPMGGWGGPGGTMSGWGGPGGMMGHWGGPGGMMGGYGYGQAYSGTVPYCSDMMDRDCAGCPMGGYWENPITDSEPLTMEQAAQAVEDYLASTGNDGLHLAEVMEFSGNFYAEIREESTGIGAFELLVNRYTGAVYPEPGPNMMWNTEYGHMNDMGMMGQWGAGAGEMSITSEQAVNLAQEYLDQIAPGFMVGEAEPFYGYYTLHTEKDGEITGMLSVNGYSGAVWYHNWHGDFIGMTGDEHE
jgi:hypothetical protein